MLLIQRREFLGLIAAAGLARASGPSGRRQPPMLRLSLSDSSRDVERGVDMGVAEAQHAASLFGGTVAIGDGPGLSVVIGGVPSAAVHDVYMNVVDLSPESRGCRREVFHIASGSWGVTWLPALTRFGADSLNKRYRSRYGAGMTPAAWCAWFAVKCSWEAALKSKATSTTELIAFLQSPEARFDGHKGTALFFDGANELRQPMYDNNGRETLQDHPREKCATWK
jgi:hypothetical protein